MIDKKAGGPCEPPAVKVISFTGRCLCLLPPPVASFRHLRFHRFEVEARASLHWRVIQEGLDFLAYQLLDEHKAPELILEPIEVLLRPFFRPIIWPACALERIEAKVGDVGHVRFGLVTEPSLGLVDEAVLLIVNAYRAEGAFAEVENFVTRGRAFTGDGGHLIVAVEMVLVSPVAEFHTVEQLLGDIRVASGIKEGGEPVHAGENAVLNGIRWHKVENLN